MRRLHPSNYEPPRVPPELTCFSRQPDTLRVGQPGKIGLLELGFEQRGGCTELVRRYQKSPLQIMRPLYIDPERPDLAVVYLMSTGGGIVQADRLRMDFDCGPGTAVHFTTQAATKLHRMDTDYATQMVNVSVGSGAYVEYLPEFTIPFDGSRFYQRTVITVDPSATVLVGEMMSAGRLARGERHGYTVFASDLELRRPDGEPFVLDRVRFQPRNSAVTGPGVWGPNTMMATLYAASPLRPAAEVADALHAALEDSQVAYGVSILPGETGAWVRFLGIDSPAMKSAFLTAWDAVRRELIGVGAPPLRKT